MCVGLCDPGAPCVRASPRGKRKEKDLELRAAPGAFPAGEPGRASPQRGEGKAALRGRAGAAPAPSAPRVPGQELLLCPRRAVVPFPSSVVVSKARCE